MAKSNLIIGTNKIPENNDYTLHPSSIINIQSLPETIKKIIGKTDFASYAQVRKAITQSIQDNEINEIKISHLTNDELLYEIIDDYFKEKRHREFEIFKNNNIINYV
ncbi:hypothetical protein II654_01530 [bacterium]|nr:hypothetical protein [bacterium]